MDRPGQKGSRRRLQIRGEVLGSAGRDGEALRREDQMRGGDWPQADSALACRSRQRRIRGSRGGVKSTGRTGGTGNSLPRRHSEKYGIGRGPPPREAASRTTKG